MVADSDFWRQEMEEPALIVLAKAGNLKSMLGGDAPVAAGSSNGPAVNVPPVPRAHPDGGSRQQMQQATVNRKGTPLCEGFQTGRCNKSNANNHRCSVEPSKVHQCAVCLDTSHGAHACGPAGANKQDKWEWPKAKDYKKRGKRGGAR